MLLLGLVGVLVCIEALADWRLTRKLYEWRDTEVSLGLAAGWAVSGVAGAALSALAIGFGYSHRILDLGSLPGGPVLAILMADLIYYVWHRLNHYVPWFWASHFPHHTAKRLNVLTSVRQGWTDVLSLTWLSWAPLGFLGFSPLQVGVYFSLLLIWEACVHSEWAPRLGPLEWVLVTPSHHRVHHSLESAHINRNFGGLLIAWDRLFGTFAAEGPAIVHRFGVTGYDSDAANPVGVAFHEWRRLLGGWRTQAAAAQSPTAAPPP